MNLSGTYTFDGPRMQVWDLLQDPAVLAKALPGCEQLTLAGDDRYEGVMKASVGPVSAARFTVVVQLKDKVAPERFSMQIDGKGAVGYTRGTAKVELSEGSSGTTDMAYTSDVQVGGTIAAVGQRLIETVARTMMRQALEALARELRARMEPGTAPS
jgi:uncharacterized protein